MQKLHIPCIKTGEFAKLCNTNKRTLFHYDEIGLFSPAFTDKKGYRFYSESQCDVFFTITCLREIGMPLKEIKQYIDQRNPDSLKKLLMEQHKKVLAEQERLQRIEQVIQTKLDLVNLSTSPKVAQHRGEVLLEDSPEEYLIISPRLHTSNHDILFPTLCGHIGYCSHNHLNAGHPYGAMIAVRSLMEQNWDTYAYFFTKVHQKPAGHPFHVKPSGKYVVTYLYGNYYNSAKACQKLLDYIAGNHYCPGEFSYKEAVLDEIAAADEADYITKISIPISP